jgi:hypothetical protein
VSSPIVGAFHFQDSEPEESSLIEMLDFKNIAENRFSSYPPPPLPFFLKELLLKK